jgi:hypothetical protein
LPTSTGKLKPLSGQRFCRQRFAFNDRFRGKYMIADRGKTWLNGYAAITTQGAQLSRSDWIEEKTAEALDAARAKARTQGREPTTAEFAAAINGVGEPPKRRPRSKRSRNRSKKWDAFQSLTFRKLHQYEVAPLGKNPVDPNDPRNYTKKFVFDLNDIDIEGIVQDIPEHNSRERIMKDLREAIEDRRNQIALFEAVLAEVTKWNWEETDWRGDDFYKTDGKNLLSFAKNHERNAVKTKNL